MYKVVHNCRNIYRCCLHGLNNAYFLSKFTKAKISFTIESVYIRNCKYSDFRTSQGREKFWKMYQTTNYETKQERTTEKNTQKPNIKVVKPKVAAIGD